MAGCECEIEIKDRSQRKVLIVLLFINAVMFLVEIGVGLISESTALIADSIDMLADAMVYGIGLYAVARAPLIKVRAARWSGMFQILLGVGVGADIVRRLVTGSGPVSLLMIGVGLAALVANVICLALIAKHRSGEVHMRASWIFSKNDVIANVGIIAAGILVYFLESNLPDLIIGAAIVAIVVRGGMHIIREADSEQKLLNYSP
ncbi:MAG: cation transporter [Pseudomonadota bacterium]|nr:MAG: cation transporter [Pseudomonadota bacterium]